MDNTRINFSYMSDKAAPPEGMERSPEGMNRI